MKSQTKYDLILIGGGAAGLLAAAEATQEGLSVLMIEKNPRLGKKLAITGKGRCNVTNNCSAEEVLKNTPRNGRFLFSAMNRFPPAEIMCFLEKNGCELKTERGNRVFPITDRSSSVIQTLQHSIVPSRFQLTQDTAEHLMSEEGHITGVQCREGKYYAPYVLLATGGCSYPMTGSTGDGYRMAQELGHTLIEPEGSLVPLVEDGTWCAAMQGLSLRNIEVSLLNSKGKAVYRDFGELLFTHFGLSGPTILSASCHMKPSEHYTISIDLKPALDEEKLDARILRDFGQYKNRDLENGLTDLYPKTMIPVLLSRLELDPAMKVNAVTKQQRLALLSLTKHFTVPISGKRPVAEAIITSGGICIKEIDPKTMGSKLIPGLFFAGEILDCDAYTGGFNLQIAWATAHAAVVAICGGTA